MAQDQDSVPPPPADSTVQTPVTGSAVRAVRLSDVEGKVQISSDGQSDFDQAQQNMPVMQGMRLHTGDDGRVEIQFEDGSVVRVTPNSALTLTELRRDADGHTVTAITADGGLTYYELNGQAGQYTVHLGGETLTPADSSVFRVNLDQNPEVAVMHGTVKAVDSANGSIDVHTNQTVKFAAANSSQYDLVPSIDSDSWDQWNSDRDQALAMLDQNATTARAGSGNPDDPAWNDLDYYGDWYDVPGYGQGWAPAGVDASWDPFGVGAWGYYSGVGYTWISGYSWGWWPYHCGAWDYFDSFGWMWFPGNCGWGSVGVGWYPYATVWRTPPGYKLPIRPTNPGHGLPPHGPGKHPEPLVAVNRTPQALNQFRTAGQAKPTARAFNFNGNAVHAEQASVHPQQSGPLGESFTNSLVRTNPTYLSVGNNRSGVIPGSFGFSNQSRTAYTGSRGGYVPPSSGARFAGSGASESHFSSAPAAPHFSAPASAPAGGSPGGGRPH
ncbi:DUF6600 domain-containing protein [Silvibacterium dinghuense]|uniref:DUF6600 domain-containing protein n=1 Tax=Silvibacterium dinghuense TaxID=1560006 RepID=UPI0013E94DCB|nr:DUF6600 domain-containing protein [Silvibacterium dinghuense]